MKILLADDDADLLDVTAYALRREGFAVIVAKDGAQALRRWQQEHPDIVVLDVNMPQLDGFDVCRQIRDAGTTPVILLTALNPEPERELRLGPLALDAESHEVTLGEQPIHLTPIEFRLLFILAANQGRVVSTARLVEYGWGYDGGDVSLLKTHVSHLRKKLGMPLDELGEIRAIPRVGYRLSRSTESA
jgi:DNA-binding response OmpR family regulator